MVKKIFLAVLLVLTLVPGAAASTSPSVNSEGLYVIENAEHLKWFSEAVNSGLSELSAVLSGDLDLGGRSWTPVGNTENTAYSGNFNGGGYFIRGLSVRGEGICLGLFGFLDYGSIVSGLNVEGASVVLEGEGGGNAGVIAGTAKGIIENCSVIKSMVSINAGRAGAGETKAGAAAGIIAGTNAEGVIIGCVSRQNYINVSGAAGNSLDVAAGSICGSNLGTVPGIGLIMNCGSLANEIVTEASEICSGGGITGKALGGSIRGCETYGGKLVGSDCESYALGGIIGMSVIGSYLEDCHVGGGLLIRAYKGTKKCYVGGLAGELTGSSVSGCFVKDVVLSAKGDVAHTMGGITGVLSNGKISDCRVANVIMPKHEEATGFTGAVAGMAQKLADPFSGAGSDIIIENIYFERTIAGGITIGRNQASVEAVTIAFDMAVSPDLFE